MRDIDKLLQSEKFHAPLESEDTTTRTWGCRHTSPNICRKAEMPSVCALVRDDGMCLAPPGSWAKQFGLLLSRRSER